MARMMIDTARLQECMAKKGITNKQLAVAVGKSEKSIEDIMNRQHENVTLLTMVKIGIALEIDWRELIAR